MTDALTRAARAISRADHEAYCQSGHDNMDILDPEGAADCFVSHARAAILSFLSGEDVVEACARAMTHEHWPGESAEFRATRLEVNTEKAQRAIAALRALVQEDGK